MKIFNTFKTAQIEFYNCTFSCFNCTIRHQLRTKIKYALSFVKFATLSRSGGTQIPNSDTFSNSVDKALGCKLRGMSER